MNTTIQQQMGVKDWLTLILLSVLWGGSFFFVGVAVTELSPLSIVFFRVFFAAITLWLIVLAFRYPIPRDRRVWLVFFIMGMLNNVIPFLLIVWGQTHIPSGLASILNATTPLFTVIVAGIFLADERASLNKILGVVLGFIGVLILLGPSLLSGDTHTATGIYLLAQIAILGAALSYSFAGVYGRRFKSMGVSLLVIATGQTTASAIMLLPVVLFWGQPQQLLDASVAVWLSMVSLAVVSTALAYILYFRILASSGVTNISLVTFLVPVSAILLGFFVLKESLHPEHFIGMAVIGLGLAAIDGRLWKRLFVKKN